MKQNPHKILFFCSALLMLVAILYAWSVFATHLEETCNWTRVATSAVFTVSICSYCVGSIISGFLQSRCTVSTKLRTAGTLLFGGFLLAGLCPNQMGILIGYGISCGCAVDIVYNALLGYAIKWFPGGPGVCNGVLLTSYGLATFPITAVAGWLLRSFGWRGTMLSFGLVEGVLVFFSGFLFTQIPSSKTRLRSGKETTSAPTISALRSRSFVCLFIWLMIITTICLAIVGSATQMTLVFDVPTALANLTPGIISVFGCMGRLGVGKLFDAVGNIKSTLLDNILVILAIIHMLIAFWTSAYSVFIIGCLLLCIGYGGMASLCACLVRSLFGAQNYSLNLSVISLQMIPASILGPIFGSSIYEFSKSYTTVCISFLVLGLLGIPLIICGLKAKGSSYRTSPRHDLC